MEDDQDVILENDVRIDANSTILKGVTIGMGAVIAAGSIVAKSVPPYQILGGVPARFIKGSFNEKELRKYKELMKSSPRV